MRRMPETHSDLIAAARAALSGGEWDTARDGFTRAIEQRETPEALEGLGWALWWLEKTEPSFAAREKAYRAYLAQSDPLAAARVATFLALDIYDFHGEAVSNGWLQRAKRHLEGIETAAEHGWIALWEGHFVRLLHGDVATARRLATEAITIARRIGVPDLELLGIALEGHALVAEGRVEEGMRQLDEATAAALAGDISDLDAAGAACCFLMHACEQVRDYDRAAQWADRVAEFSRRWRIRPLYAICRVHYAVVLYGRGHWDEAEQVLTTALNELGAERGPARNEATMHLGELRRRQGRWDEAQTLFAEVEGMSLALIGRAAMALDAGDAASAVPLLERALRRVASDNWTARTAALGLLARAQIAAGMREPAARSLEDLQSIADLVATDHVRASARHAAAFWMQAEGEQEAARHALEDAIDLFLEAGAPYEAHGARLDLVRTLATGGHAALAAQEAKVAHAAFEKLGARRDAEVAMALVSEAAGGGRPPAAATSDGPLSRREAEVVALIAEGLGDKEIAARLHLSEHTIHRHVSNVMLKLEVPSRAAAVAQAVRRGLI
jgi:DNA-binding NarL/FixJ family response regulator